jgi:hypothetical protein
MGTLNDLGVTRGTPQLLPPSQLLQVCSVVKGHVLKDHLPLQILTAMTSLLKTGGITDLRMRHGRPFAGNKHDQGNLSILPFPLQMIEKAGFIVTSSTGNKVVGRSLPGVYVYLHVMTEITEGGSFGKFVHSPRQDYQEEKTDAEE